VHTTTPILAIRVATAHDAADLHRLARLDSRRTPQGRVLLGIVDGAVRAAVSIDTGAAVADPFHPTADVLDLLHLRAERLRTDVAAAGSRATRVRSLLIRRRRLTSTA
jgi:hypothetical protein